MWARAARWSSTPGTSSGNEISCSALRNRTRAVSIFVDSLDGSVLIGVGLLQTSAPERLSGDGSRASAPRTSALALHSFSAPCHGAPGGEGIPVPRRLADNRA